MNKGVILGIITILSVVTISLILFFHSPETILQGEVVIRQYQVSSKVSGYIQEIHAKEGDMITKGELLVEIDTPELHAKYAQAQAALKAADAQKNKADKGSRDQEKDIYYNNWQKAIIAKELTEKTYNRLKTLFDEGVIAEQTVDEAKAKYELSKNDLAVAKAAYDMSIKGARVEDKDAAKALSEQASGVVKEVESYINNAKLFSPIDGEVDTIVMEAGELAGAGFPILTILDTSDLWVSFNIRENLMPHIKIGNTFKARIPAIDKDEHEFVISYIAKQGDYAVWSATKTSGEFDMKSFEVRAKPVNDIDGLRSGMSVIYSINNNK